MVTGLPVRRRSCSLTGGGLTRTIGLTDLAFPVRVTEVLVMEVTAGPAGDVDAEMAELIALSSESEVREGAGIPCSNISSNHLCCS